MRSTSSVAELQTGGRRKQDRDQRAELRRLQQVLLTSAQQAFDSEIWESCGIEAEHLKRQQLAALLSTGLAKSLPKNSEEEEDAAQPVAGRASVSSLKQSGTHGRVTMALGVHFKDEDHEITEHPQPGLAASTKISGRRKSGHMLLRMDEA